MLSTRSEIYVRTRTLELKDKEERKPETRGSAVYRLSTFSVGVVFTPVCDKTTYPHVTLQPAKEYCFDEKCLGLHVKSIVIQRDLSCIRSMITEVLIFSVSRCVSLVTAAVYSFLASSSISHTLFTTMGALQRIVLAFHVTALNFAPAADTACIVARYLHSTCPILLYRTLPLKHLS